MTGYRECRMEAALRGVMAEALSGFPEKEAVGAARGMLTVAVERWLGMASYEVADFEDELEALVGKWRTDVAERRGLQ